METFSKDETTFKDEALLEPLDFYKSQLKDAFHDNAEEYFDKLTKKSKIDVEANRLACKKYYEECKSVDSLKKDKSGKVGLKALFIVFLVLLAIAITIIITLTFTNSGLLHLAVSIAVPIGAAGLIALCIVGIVKQNKLISGLNEEIDKHNGIASKCKDEASQLIAGLNRLFESNMAVHLMSKTTPVVDLDQDFDPEKYSYLHEKYGYETSNRKDESILFVQSGHILGNPFIIERVYNQNMVNHVYTGTLTISWTERVSNGKGGYTTVVRTQTLTAHVTAPLPNYWTSTRLIFGSEAAPRLSFSRHPTGHGNDDDKALERYVKKFDKELDKKVAKDLKDGNASFTRLYNETFEALFNALDRDNETEFRLLFTPLAQKNMINLIRDVDNIGYGDDFSFIKRKELNYINASHLNASKTLDYGPENIRHFDYDIVRSNFINYCDTYCKEIYFALAPLICIPLYQQHKTREYIYNGQFGHNITQAEAESAANKHSWNLFKHPATRSLGVILKSRFEKVNETVDECIITAHSFSGTDRVTYVSVYGGDGHYHQVPVHWVEYNPISQDTCFAIGRAKEDNYVDFSDKYTAGDYNKLLSRYNIQDTVLYRKGLYSFVKKD